MKPAKPRASEASIQIAIRDFLRIKGIRSRHIPNGGTRHPREAANLRRQGVVAGMPDLICWTARGDVGFLEIKAADGRLSERQHEQIDSMRADGLRVAVVRSIDDAAAVLREWGWT